MNMNSPSAQREEPGATLLLLRKTPEIKSFSGSISISKLEGCHWASWMPELALINGIERCHFRNSHRPGSDFFSMQLLSVKKCRKEFSPGIDQLRRSAICFADEGGDVSLNE